MSKKIALRIATPVVIAGALFGLAGGAQAMASVGQAAPKPAAAMAHLTQGFEIRNLSGYDIVLQNIESPGNGDGTPAVGTVLRPGDAIPYQKVFWFGNTPHTKLQFTQLRPNTHTTFEVELWIDPFLNIPSVMTQGASGAGDLQFDGAGYGSKQLSFVDRPGSAPIEVSAADKQRQADLLQRLCIGGQAACTFAPTRTTAGTPVEDIKLAEKNVGTETVKFTLKDSFAFGASSNMEFSGSVGSSFFGLVDVSLSAKYGQGWTTTTTKEISREFPTPPGHTAFMKGVQQTIRQYGTFTVKMNNTTWHLNDVYFDIPDPKKGPEVIVGAVLSVPTPAGAAG